MMNKQDVLERLTELLEQDNIEVISINHDMKQGYLEDTAKGRRLSSTGEQEITLTIMDKDTHKLFMSDVKQVALTERRSQAWLTKYLGTFDE